jgi:hypothetical protein
MTKKGLSFLEKVFPGERQVTIELNGKKAFQKFLILVIGLQKEL